MPRPRWARRARVPRRARRSTGCTWRDGTPTSRSGTSWTRRSHKLSRSRLPLYVRPRRCAPLPRTRSSSTRRTRVRRNRVTRGGPRRTVQTTRFKVTKRGLDCSSATFRRHLGAPRYHGVALPARRGRLAGDVERRRSAHGRPRRGGLPRVRARGARRRARRRPRAAATAAPRRFFARRRQSRRRIQRRRLGRRLGCQRSPPTKPSLGRRIESFSAARPSERRQVTCVCVRV
ncbi:hypothetical protein M885DRAFT_530109 [Pelagophyceae sp. CCMP2097]|nr:hypothetical protein M885DRAFT_530109 [Pelagophyceae sp. CCMP2097]